MKKILILLLFLPFIANAQLFSGGLDLGFTATQIDGDGLGGYNKAGVSATGYTRMKINDKLSLVSGVGYVQKGSRFVHETTFFLVRLNYAEIPLYLTYKPFDKFSFDGGFTFDYFINGYLNRDGRDFYNGYLKDELNLRQIDLSYFLSVNYHLNDRLNIKLTNNYSLLPITNPSSGSCYSLNFLLTYFIQDPYADCWWNKVLRITFQYKIF